MNWFYRLKRNFLIRFLNALGFGGVIGFCLAGCDSKPATQENQNNTVEIQSNITSPTDTNQEAQTDSDSVDVVNDAKPETEKPEIAEPETAEIKPEESQSNSETNSELQENQELQANAEANDSNPAPEERNDVQPVDEVEVVKKRTKGAIKITYSPKDAIIKYTDKEGHVKIICRESPCYIKINNSEKRVSAILSAPGYLRKNIDIKAPEEPNKSLFFKLDMIIISNTATMYLM